MMINLFVAGRLCCCAPFFLFRQQSARLYPGGLVKFFGKKILPRKSEVRQGRTPNGVEIFFSKTRKGKSLLGAGCRTLQVSEGYNMKSVTVFC